MSVCLLTQQLSGKGSPFKRLDSVKSDRSSVCGDDDSRRVCFDVEEPGIILTLYHITTLTIRHFGIVLIIIQKKFCFIVFCLDLLKFF